MIAFIWLSQPDTAQQAAYPFLRGDWVALDGRAVGVLVLLAVANVAIHVALAKAYQSAPPPVVATFDYGYLVFAVGWGLLLQGEMPNLTTLAGMAMIAGAGLLTVWRRRAVRVAGS